MFEQSGVLPHDGRARLLVIAIRITGAGAGAGFDEDAMPAFDQLIRGRGWQRRAIFLLFDFFGYGDNHRTKAKPALSNSLLLFGQALQRYRSRLPLRRLDAVKFAAHACERGVLTRGQFQALAGPQRHQDVVRGNAVERASQS